ncbi:MAG: hypothetical protein WDA12_02980 [Bacilli bacterium]
MSVKIERLSEERVRNMIEDDDTVFLRTTGQTSNITFTEKLNTECHVKRLPNNQYQILRTGEIKDCKPQIEDRSGNIKSLKRTFKTIRDTINTNCTDVEKCRMITLTYEENMTNTKQFDKDINLFVKNFNYNYGKSENIKICEPQGRGALHAHIIFIWDKKAPYIPIEEINKMWGHGYTYIQSLYGNVDNLGVYFTAILSDLPIEDAKSINIDYEDKDIKEIWYDVKAGKRLKSPKCYVKGARLHLYPPKFRIYRGSRGLKKPAEEKTTYSKAKEKVGSAIPTYVSAFRITDKDKKWSNLIIKEYYNSKRFPEVNENEPQTFDFD